MAKIKSAALAEALAGSKDIVVKKSLFGTKMQLVASGSKIDVKRYDYSLADGAVVEGLLAKSEAELQKALAGGGQPAQAPIGSLVAEVATSADHQWAAVQIMAYGGGLLNDRGPVRTYTGSHAALVAQIFA